MLERKCQKVEAGIHTEPQTGCIQPLYDRTCCTNAPLTLTIWTTGLGCREWSSEGRLLSTGSASLFVHLSRDGVLSSY